MKLRHLIPWIPLLALLLVFMSAEYYFTHPKKYEYIHSAVEFTWGTVTAYYCSMIYQIIIGSTIIILAYNG